MKQTEENIQFYLRSGKKVSRRVVQKAQINYALAKRTGKMGGISCSIQPLVADRVESMTAEQFCSWSGQFIFVKKNT